MPKNHELSAAERLDAIARILAEGIHRWMLQQKCSTSDAAISEPPARCPDIPAEPGQ
jgi:hypothetical protein